MDIPPNGIKINILLSKSEKNLRNALLMGFMSVHIVQPLVSIPGVCTLYFRLLRI